MTTQDSLARQMGLLFGGRLLAQILTFVTPLVLVRLLSPEEYGLYKQLFLLHGTLLMLLGWTLPLSLYYFLPRDIDNRAQWVCQTLVLLTACGGIGLVGLLALQRNISVWLNSPQLSVFIPYLGVATFLISISSILEIVMITTGQARLAGLTTMMSQLVKALLITVAAIAAQSVLAIMIAVIVLGTVRVGCLFFYAAREKLLTRRVLDRNRLGVQAGYVLPFGLAGVVETLASSVPHYYVASIYEPAIFAIFAVGCFNLSLISILFDSVSDVTLVKITELQKSESLDRIADILAESVRRLCLVCFPIWLFLLAMADDVVTVLFTKRFEASVPIFMVFIVSIPLAALSLDYVPRAFADTAFLLRVNALRLALTLVLLVMLTGPFGLPGAAAATISALAMTRAVVWARAARLTHTTIGAIIPWRNLCKITCCSVIAMGTILIFERAIHVQGLLNLLVSMVIFSTTYVVLILRFKIINRDEMDAAAFYLGKVRLLVGGQRASAGPHLS